MADIRNSRKVRALAAELREQCALRGVVLVAGEAEEILAQRIHAIARKGGITEQYVMDQYLPANIVSILADSIESAGETYRQAVDAADSVTINQAEAGRVIAAAGMTMKLATVALEQPSTRMDALGVATDCADAIVGIGVTMRGGNEDGTIEISGRTVVFVRKVLQRTIELIREGSWACPCASRHVDGDVCDLQRNLISDLKVVGGWIASPEEPPAWHR